jgi:beta-glucosidase
VAARSTFQITEKNCFNNTWFADPLIKGTYPEDGLRLFAEYLPPIQTNDLDTICQPLDFYGINVYQGRVVQANEAGEVVVIPPADGAALTTMDWSVTPGVLYWGSKFLYERYQLPIVVTENGMANMDWVHQDGKVHDPQRIDFLAQYLGEYQRAIAEGVEAMGYFVWSIMDNFEWAYGFKQRFGLIYVDYETQKRQLKDSAYWYKEVIANNGSKYLS